MMRTITLLALLSLAPNALGCTCSTYPRDLNQAARLLYDTTLAIFVGTAESVKILPGRYRTLEAVFSVKKVWKGNIGSRVTISESSGLSCSGFDFESGVTYLVFAHPGTDDTYGVDVCKPSVPTMHVTDLIEALDRIHAAN